MTNGIMHRCANIYKLNEGVKKDNFSIRYWECISNNGCGKNIKKGYSAISINQGNWLPGIIKSFNYKNDHSGQIFCVKQDNSIIEYCWKKGEFIH